MNSDLDLPAEESNLNLHHLGKPLAVLAIVALALMVVGYLVGLHTGTANPLELFNGSSWVGVAAGFVILAGFMIGSTVLAIAAACRKA